jgi:two-component system, OmpR family, response regulator
MKVLLVDDEEDVREIARLSLGRVGGMDVCEASNGPEALQRAEEEKPDFILMDMMMPGMDGPATLLALRANPSTASIPIVFLTAKALPSEVERLHQLGAAGVITKPFDPMTLAREVRRVLGQ